MSGVVASYEKFSSFTRCSRRVFLCAYSELDDGRDGVRVLREVYKNVDATVPKSCLKL